MKAWEIYSHKHPDWPEPHPAVIVSHPDRVAMKPEVTILLCSSKKATRTAKPHEVILDSSDGLDWPTVCKCDLLYTLPRMSLAEIEAELEKLSPDDLRRLALKSWTVARGIRESKFARDWPNGLQGILPGPA